MIINSKTSIDDLLTFAKCSFIDVNPGEEFIVQDLFRQFEWNRIDVPVRMNLGVKFFKYAESLGSTKIKPNGKTDSVQQKYIKL